ncbi:MAG: hypothetical protein U5Q03_10050 [Bacteroidota bacterium]|nr:hypothetical protein [Bacteroidota bacterium]
MEKPNLQEEAYHYLKSIQKWSYFISLTGMILLVLSVVLMMFFGFAISKLMSLNQVNDMGAMPGQAARFGSTFMVIIYIIIMIIYFFPIYFLFRFSVNLKKSLKSGDDYQLSNAFNFLGKHYTYIGVLMIIGIIIYVIAIVFTGIGLLMGSGIH